MSREEHCKTLAKLVISACAKPIVGPHAAQNCWVALETTSRQKQHLGDNKTLLLTVAVCVRALDSLIEHGLLERVCELLPALQA